MRFWRPQYRYSSSSLSSESDPDSASVSVQSPNVNTSRNASVASVSLLQNTNPSPNSIDQPTTRSSLNPRRDILNDTLFDHSVSLTHSQATVQSSGRSQHSNTGRMRWTKDMNKNLIYAYYKATELDSNKKNYLSRLYLIWKSLQPDLDFNSNKLGGQVRSILNRKVFTDHEIEMIKNKVKTDLELQSSHPSQILPPVMSEPSRDDQPTLDEYSPPSSMVRSHDMNETHVNNMPDIHLQQYQLPDPEITETFDSMVHKYENVEIDMKPTIPKVPYNNFTLKTVSQVNDALKSKFESSQNITQTHNFIYCAALTVCFLLNIKIPTDYDHSRSNMNNNPPPWKTRLENQIKNIRRKIGIITEYFKINCQVSQKVKNKIQQIAYELKIKPWEPDYNKQLKIQCEKFKQKAAALGYRIRKYNKRKKKFTQNKLFKNNQKKFYKSLNESDMTKCNGLPTSQGLFGFWNELWGHENVHKQDAAWIQEEETRMENLCMMRSTKVTTMDVTHAAKYLKSWKSPGPDQVQNYWFKMFSNCHPVLAKQFQGCLEQPHTFPEKFTKGITYMVPKNQNTHEPGSFRPITCLPTIYKLLSSIIKTKIYNHVNENHVLAQEQNGIKRNARGSKELLVIDSIVTKHAKQNKRNLSVSWIDYRKCYDSIPHSWLIKILSIYKIDPMIINFLKLSMNNWSTELLCKMVINETTHETREIKTDKIMFKRGIFQGDPLSSLLFCLCLNPLSNILNSSSVGYKIDMKDNYHFNHLFYMDDLKIYANGTEQLRYLLELVSNFSESICMSFGLDKCNVLNIKKGKLCDPEDMTLSNKLTINSLQQDEQYKYLGIHQQISINHSEIKKQYETSFMKRVTTILKTELNARNKIQSINCWAIPLLAYTFGIIAWTDTDLSNLNRKVRTTLTRYRSHHVHSATERLYLPRREGGRGLMDLQNVYSKQVVKLRTYFENKRSKFISYFKQADIFTPLRLSNSTFTPPIMKTNEDMKTTLMSGVMKGRYPKILYNDPQIDRVLSTSYLQDGYLMSETEGFIHAIQDQVMKTRNYMKHIMKVQIDTELCRLCNQVTESIQHLSSGCSVLAPKEYTTRHNLVANVIHQELLKKIVSSKATNIPHYQYKPAPVVENEQVKICWNLPIQTETNVMYNRPDILYVNKTENSACIIDVTIPLDDNVSKAYSTKITKYEDLRRQIKRINEFNEVSILPIVISSNGLIHKNTMANLEKMKIENTKSIIKKCQRSVIISTTSIIRRVLAEED
ncbi:hypothetical protein WDU94_000033 [Cyamophila willieti]